MNTIKVAKLRPVSWRVYVQGKEEADYARTLLSSAGIHTTFHETEPGLLDPPIFSFVATPDANTPMTSIELEVLLQRDEMIELAFENNRH